MFAQPYGALPPVPTPRPGDDDDVWHVAISWDDIKVMSVEQLDDAFRLDIISSDTMVWQKGMSGWQQLGVVAGIGGDSEEDDDDDDDDQEDVLTVADVEVVWPPFPGPAKAAPIVRSARPTPAPPRPPSRAPLPPAPAVIPSRVQTQAWPALASAPRPVSVAPVIPLAPRPVPTASLMPPSAPSASLMPPAGFGAPSALYQAANANAIPRHPPTTPPVAMSVTMPPPSFRRPSSAARVGRWLLAIAFVGGLATTLYRNDLLLQAAQKYGFEKQYLGAERAVVGTPGFGTLRSLAGLLSVEKLKLGSSESIAPAAIAAPAATTETPSTDTDSADTKTEPTPSTAETKTTTKAEGAVDVGSLKLETATRKTTETPASTKPSAKQEAKPAKKLSKAEARAAAQAEAKAAKAAAKAAAAKAAAAKVAAAKAAKTATKNDEAQAARALIEARKAKLAKEGKLAVAEPKAEKAPKADKPEPAPKREAPPPVAAKPEKPTTAKGILDAAIRDSMENGSFAPPKKKKKSGPNADYDPMNGDL